MELRRPVAEALGTFVLVLGGVGAAVIAGDKIGNLGIAFAFGLSLLAMAYAIGPISGCHINPAVTLGLLVSRRIPLGEAVRYWIGQVAGAIVAAALLLRSSARARAVTTRARRAWAPTDSATTRRAATRGARRSWWRSS
jgi:aquaporin Z